MPQPSTSQNDRSTTERLLDEAVRLAKAFNKSQATVASQVSDMKQLIEQSEMDADHDLNRDLYKKIIGKSRDVGERGLQLASVAESIVQAYGKDNYGKRRFEIATKLSTANPNDFGDSFQTALIERSWKIVERTPDEADLCVSAVEILLISQGFFFADSIATFLARPSKFRRALDDAGLLVQAITADIAGKAIPFLGTLKTVLQLMEPRIERELKESAKAVHFYDRVFHFDDQLGEVHNYMNYVEETERLAIEALDQARAPFRASEDWLSEALK